MKEELLTKEEAQKYLKISQSTLNLMMKRKELPYVKLQRRVLFRKKDIDKFLESKIVK